MNFNKHWKLEGQHSFLSASKHYWLNYDDNKLIESFRNSAAAQRGTELHDFAKRCIELGIKLPKTHTTLNMYVNDAIGFKMTPEQVLYFSDNCFGTADAISFRKNMLRIHDYKSGVTPASMDQLMIYSALFCLEYHVDPNTIQTELRIYQNNDVAPYEPIGEEIKTVMEKIIHADKVIEQVKGGDFIG